MKYCQFCGKEIEDDAVICVHCGRSLSNNQITTTVNDAPSAWWGFLGFCIPLLGLILWLSWRKTTPLKAKSAGIGTLIGLLPLIAFVILLIIGLAGGLA